MEANQQRLDAWKAGRTGGGTKASRTIFSPSSSTASADGPAPPGSKKRGREEAPAAAAEAAASAGMATTPLAVPATGPGAVTSASSWEEEEDQGRPEERGEVVYIGEDAIDLLLGGLPGAAVQNGKAASVPRLE